MENKSIRVINLSGYEVPEIKEVQNKQWIQYGEDNCYFDDLIDRYLGRYYGRWMK